MSTFDAQAFEKAEAGGDNQPPREGGFELAIDGLKAFRSKAGKDLVLVEVRDVETGSMWTVIGSFGSAGAMAMTKEMCSSLGADMSGVSSLDDLNQRLQVAAGGFFKARVERNGDFWNTYFDERIAADVPAEVSEAVAAAKADDDVPF